MKQTETTRLKARRLAARALCLLLLACSGASAHAQTTAGPPPKFLMDPAGFSVPADGPTLRFSSIMAQAGIASANFQLGDVFAAVNGGRVNWYRSNGTFVQQLQNGTGFTTGMAFDSDGKLYVTQFSENRVAVYNTDGSFSNSFGGGYTTPEALVFDAAGNAYISNVGGTGIRKYAANGTFIQVYAAGRVDFLDLDPDQCTMYFGQEGRQVLRYNVCTNAAMTPFSGATSQAYSLRLLANGTMLVANGPNIVRLNASGTVVQTYDPNGEDNWFALNLDPNGTSFWSGSFGSSNFYRINIATGAVELGPINTGTGGSSFFGLAVFGEITQAASADLSIDKGVASGTVTAGATGTFTLSVKNNGPSAATGVTVVDTLAASLSYVAASGGATCSAAGKVVTCDFGSVANGATKTVSIIVQTSVAARIVNFATVSGGEGDATPSNNRDSATLNVVAGGGGPCMDPLTEPSFDGNVIRDGARRLVAFGAPQGAVTVEFYSTSANLVIGTPETAAGVAIAHTRVGNTFTFTGTPPTAVRFPISSSDAGTTSVSFFVRVVDTCQRTVNLDPQLEVTAAEGDETAETALLAPAPNPFGGSTRLGIVVAEAGIVRVSVFDALGREVARLVDGPLAPGRHAVTFDGSSLPAGVYVVRMRAGAFHASRTVTLLQ